MSEKGKSRAKILLETHGNYKIIKASVHQNRAIPNMSAPNDRLAKQ